MHALAADLRPRRSLWLSRRAPRTTVAVLAATVVALTAAVCYRLVQRPYAFDELHRIAVVSFPGAGAEGPGSRVFIDGERAFAGYPLADGRFALRSVTLADPGGHAAWVNDTLTDVESFSYARGSVIVTGLPGSTGQRHITLLNASNGVPYVTLEVGEGDRWSLIGRYFVDYRHTEHQLVINDVGTRGKIFTLDQAVGAGRWWLTDNWSGQQVPTAVDGAALHEPQTVDPHVLRATPGGGFELVDLASGRVAPAGAAGQPGTAGPDDVVYPYEEQVFVADQRPGYRLRAFDREQPGGPDWTWTSPDPQPAPAFVAACGEHRVCVADARHVTALDTASGKVAFRVDLDDAARLLPVGDRVLLRHDDAESLLDADGKVLRTWPASHAARVDAGSFLLLPAAPPGSGAYSWRGVPVDDPTPRPVGSLDVQLGTCTWSHLYVACGERQAGRFAFYRVRGAPFPL